MNNRFTKKAENALKKAVECSGELGHTYIGTEHILMGLCCDRDSVSFKTLSPHGVTFDSVKKAVIEVSGKGIPGTVTADNMTPGAKSIVEQSAHLAKKASQNFIGTEHLLLAIINEQSSVGARTLEMLNVSLQEIKNELIAFTESTDTNKKSSSSKSMSSAVISGCPSLSEYGRDLTLAAQKGRFDPIIGRSAETERVIQILSRRTKNNPCLIGEPGVGKTAVVEGLAQKIAAGEVPQMLKEKTIVILDIPLMIAGAKYRGEFEERLKNVMKEAAQNPDIILFIDEMHTIIGAGAAEGAVDAANIIKPALARGELQMIGATTISEYRKHIEKDPALERRFQSVTVCEPSVDDTKKILFGLRHKYEEHHGLKISDEAINASVILSSRYITDRFLPDKAIDLIDEAASRLKINMYTVPPKLKSLEAALKTVTADKEKAVIAQKFERAAMLRDREEELKKRYEKEKKSWETRAMENKLSVAADDIADIVTQWTGIPVNKLIESESERLMHLADRLHETVIGQNSAIETVSNAIIRGRTGVSSPDRPIGSFIFLGATGTGKTQLTKALAQALFGSKDAVLRFDMSEYMEKHSVSKLIGSPPGYVGYGDGGLLTEKIRRKPYSVVLFDEIEKADPEVFNLLLQVLDEGKLTDSQGREANFRNAVLIMTSNAGAGRLSESAKIGFSNASQKGDDTFNQEEQSAMMKEIKKIFSPEFLNRIDDIVIFERLSYDDLKKITLILLNEFYDRMREKGITVEFDESAINLITDTGYSNEYGARHLRRAITHLVEDKFALYMLNNSIKSGDMIKMIAKKDKENKNYIDFISCE